MKPELLSPAGSIKSMRYAFAYGADAVYAGQPRYSLRVRNNEFSRLSVLAQAIDEAHRLGKRFYLAANLAPHNDKVRSFHKDLAPIIDLGPDALIMSDPGLIMMARDRWPEVPVHLSVQANVVNYASVRFWQQAGIRRVILSRELSLAEIGQIREECPDMELEVFVHGALCIAYSGRCLLSGYMTHRDSNQGACTNSCRWRYRLHEAEVTMDGDVMPTAGSDVQGRYFLLEEDERPGELMPAFEDEHGTYIMNSKDLRAVQHVAELMSLGVTGIKIEGRTKSHFYVARTAQVYRRAIEDAMSGRAFDPGLLEDLEGLASRGYTEGFYRRHSPAELQNYLDGSSRTDRQHFVGEVMGAVDGSESGADTEGLLLRLHVKNRFERGDRVELMTPAGNRDFTLDAMWNEDFAPIDVAPGSGHVVYIRDPGGRTPVGRTPGGRTPGGRTPGGRTPDGRTPVGRTPDGRTPDGRTPGGRTPDGRTPGGRTPGGRTPDGRTPDGRTPGGRTPPNTDASGGWGLVLRYLS